MRVEEIVNRTRVWVDDMIGKIGGIPPVDAIPKPGDSRLGQVIGQLREDAIKARDAAFAATKDERFGHAKPMEFAENLLKLESGNHWEVFGHRNAETGVDDWKQEVVDDEIGDQIRARTAYLCSAWHDVIVSPNIQGINEILDEERRKTRWGTTARRMVKYMSTLGQVDVKSYLDKRIDPRGVANEMVCKHGSVVFSPFAVDKASAWYVTASQEITGQEVKLEWPEFKLENAARADREFVKSMSLSSGGQPELDTTYTHRYALIECYMDDWSLEDVPFEQDEFDARVGAILSGDPNAKAEKDDNHPKWVEAYLKFLDERLNLATRLRDKGEFTPEDDAVLEQMGQVIGSEIEAHVRLADASAAPAGKRFKYPYGRLVVTIDGQVVQDDPNPYEFDWRMLFHRGLNEEVPGRLDGRSDVEILWNVQKSIDQNLSRFQDAAIIQGQPKPFFHEDDRQTIEKDGYSNDPTKPGFYRQAPPQFPKGQVPLEYLQLYEKHKMAAQKKLGISEVTFGKSPTSNASGDLVDALIQQNQVLVTGEANQNLQDMVEDIIETRLAMMKQFYTEPRIYPINGVEQAVVVSQILTTRMVEENGAQVEKEVEGIEVKVLPESNVPMRWERDLALLSRVAAITYPNGMPIVPPDMIVDLLSQRFPGLAQGGKYRQMNELMQIGAQVVAQQQAQQQMAAQQAKRGNGRPAPQPVEQPMGGV